VTFAACDDNSGAHPAPVVPAMEPVTGQRKHGSTPGRHLLQEGTFSCVSSAFLRPFPGDALLRSSVKAQKDLEVPAQETISNNYALLPATRWIIALSYYHKGSNISSQNSPVVEDVLENKTKPGLGFLRMKSLRALWLNCWCESMLC